MNYIVACIHEWNVEAFKRHSPQLPGSWTLITRPEDLTPELLEKTRPRYLFFPHWSWKVPDAILALAECVCFHMTDVPYGRGGSPLQNLIIRGHRDTRLSALRMVAALDAGPVYLKSDLSLEGSAEEIFRRAAELVWLQIGEIVRREPLPQAQEGEITAFPRRRPEDSRLPESGTAEELHDRIRMMDAPSYPKAFLEFGGWRLEFSKACYDKGDLTATVRFIPANKPGGTSHD
ncbi:MAG: hypothetical protein RL095_376 [Verrucomicrobiota bacterium]|jgi:methionyl-tRNA formyltransferase